MKFVKLQFEPLRKFMWKNLCHNGLMKLLDCNVHPSSNTVGILQMQLKVKCYIEEDIINLKLKQELVFKNFRQVHSILKITEFKLETYNSEALT